MAYILNEYGVMESIPNNSALPTGARWATADEVRDYEEAERIRTAAGIPAPKSPQQAKLEHDALLENIANRGGLATPQERVNLEITAEQAGTVVTREDAPVPESADLRPVKVQGRGETAGDQYTQYEPLPGVAKVVTDETPAKSADAAKSSPTAKSKEK